jgi:hypothetical protein
VTRRLVWVALVAAGAIAHAEPRPPGTVVDGEHRYRLVIAEGWRPLDAPEDTLLAYAGPDGAAYLALARIDLPGRAAWQNDQSFLDAIERGVSSHADGYARISRKVHKLGEVPAMDLRYRRTDSAGMGEVATRFLFYRTYALVLSIELGEDHAARRQADKILASFQPYAPE